MNKNETVKEYLLEEHDGCTTQILAGHPVKWIVREHYFRGILIKKQKLTLDGVICLEEIF